MAGHRHDRSSKVGMQPIMLQSAALQSAQAAFMLPDTANNQHSQGRHSHKDIMHSSRWWSESKASYAPKSEKSNGSTFTSSHAPARAPPLSAPLKLASG